jgi:SAM-dependent methyltransferase
MGIENVTFLVDNILTMDLGEVFDVIINMGVLHHLSDMSLGLKNLARHLAEGGYLVLWLYGRYGRFRLNLNQAMFRILFQEVGSLERKVALTKRALASFPRQLTTCHFNVPRTEIEDDFGRSLEFAIENEAWLVDQFLHVREKTVSMEDILGLLEESGLRMAKWLSVSQNIESYTGDPEIIKIFRELGGKSQLLVLDLLIKPNYYLVVAEREGTGRGLGSPSPGSVGKSWTARK